MHEQNETAEQSPENIRRLAQIVASRVCAMILEGHAQISDAITALVEQNQSYKQEGDKPKEPVLALAFGAKWGLDSNNVAVSMRVNVSHKFEKEARIDPDNPDQLNLFGAGIQLLASEGLPEGGEND
jgi:hypothetical protein